MTLEQAAQQALEALQWIKTGMGCNDIDATITALREALAQPQEPSKCAEDYLRATYGAYRGHYAWRALEEAFEAGRKAQSQGEYYEIVETGEFAK